MERRQLRYSVYLNEKLISSFSYRVEATDVANILLDLAKNSNEKSEIKVLKDGTEIYLANSSGDGHFQVKETYSDNTTTFRNELGVVNKK